MVTGVVPAAVDAPNIFQLPAVGDNAPPVLPVIVSPTALPLTAILIDPAPLVIEMPVPAVRVDIQDQHPLSQ